MLIVCVLGSEVLSKMVNCIWHLGLDKCSKAAHALFTEHKGLADIFYAFQELFVINQFANLNDVLELNVHLR